MLCYAAATHGNALRGRQSAHQVKTHYVNEWLMSQVPGRAEPPFRFLSLVREGVSSRTPIFNE